MKWHFPILALIFGVTLIGVGCSKKEEPPRQIVRPKSNKPVVLAQNFSHLTNPSTDTREIIPFQDVPDDIQGVTEEEAELLEEIVD